MGYAGLAPSASLTSRRELNQRPCRQLARMLCACIARYPASRCRPARSGPPLAVGPAVTQSPPPPPSNALIANQASSSNMQRQHRREWGAAERPSRRGRLPRCSSVQHARGECRSAMYGRAREHRGSRRTPGGASRWDSQTRTHPPRAGALGGQQSPAGKTTDRPNCTYLVNPVFLCIVGLCCLGGSDAQELCIAPLYWLGARGETSSLFLAISGCARARTSGPMQRACSFCSAFQSAALRPWV
jgi:hypothetical protein